MHLSNWARRVLLFAEAGVCFGPLGLLCLLGVVALPMWIKLLLIEITGRVDMHNSGGTSAIVWPIVFVLTGIAGLTGLVRLIPVLSGGHSTSRDILLTRAMVFIGVFGLATFLFYPGALRTIPARGWRISCCLDSVPRTCSSWVVDIFSPRPLASPEGRYFRPVATRRRAAVQAPVRLGPVQKPQSASRSGAVLEQRRLFLRHQGRDLCRYQANECVGSLDPRAFDNSQVPAIADYLPPDRCPPEQLVQHGDLGPIVTPGSHSPA